MKEVNYFFFSVFCLSPSKAGWRKIRLLIRKIINWRYYLVRSYRIETTRCCSTFQLLRSTWSTWTHKRNRLKPFLQWLAGDHFTRRQSSLLLRGEIEDNKKNESRGWTYIREYYDLSKIRRRVSVIKLQCSQKDVKCPEL